jgi:signal transduction histidine kinase
VRRQRAWLAVGVSAGVALIAVVITLVGFWAAGRAGTAPRPIVTRVDQIGDRVSVVQVDGVGSEAAASASRASALHWVLATLGVALVPIAAGAWLVSGRFLSRPPVAPEAGPRASETSDANGRHLQEVVHELRTPLAVAATNLDLAATTPGLEQDLATRLAAARRGVERMARTVDDLSVHGRLVLGEDSVLVDLSAEVEALAAEHAGPARLRRLSLTVDRPSRLPVSADVNAVRTAVGNLIANAVRLGPAGSVIELSCGSYQDWCWIAIRDEGPGLPPEDHERAFRRYWRGRYDTDRDGGGSDGGARGLGLTIARQVTEAQGGHLTLRSAVGTGSTFVVWLPRSPEARTERVVADDGVHHRIEPWCSGSSALRFSSRRVAESVPAS